MISTLLSWMEFMFSHVDKFKYVTKTKLVIRYPSGYRESVDSFVKIIKNFTFKEILLIFSFESFGKIGDSLQINDYLLIKETTWELELR